MCKCCQSVLDTCYWHCYGKFHFDEEIALYEDENKVEKKDSRGMDNLAFWDNVSVIASRSVIILQPTPRKLSLEALEARGTTKSNIKITIDTPDSTNIDGTLMNSDTYPNLTDEEKYIKITDTPFNENGQKNKFRKKSAIEDIIDKRVLTPNSERMRKKSLKERRNSTADLTLDLTCKFDHDFHEIPVIRQNSVPKFFLDYTPEYNPFAETSVLASPILAHTCTPQFDLKSVVQIENEIEHAIQAKRTPSRLANIKRKMKPILIKKPSTKSLPDTINHI